MSASVRVLLVDDDSLARESLAATFHLAGFDVLEAGSGREALRLLAEQPRLVVLDVHLPDVSGFELCRRIKSMPGMGSVAILHLSALYTGSEDRSRGLDGGAEAFLIKPVDPRELLATARALLRIHAAQEAVEKTARQWRTTFDALSDAVCLLDPAGVILRCNRAMADLLGKACARPSLESPQLAALPALWPSEGAVQREVRHVRLGERWFLARRDPILDRDGRPDAYVVILSDVTQRRQMEEQLRQSQKMEAVGRLAGGVAHDFNNLLTAILGSSSLIRSQLSEGEEEGELHTVEKAAWKAAELTRQLLGFSQQTLLWLKPCCLNDCVSQAAVLLLRSLDPRILLETRLHPSLGQVRADPAQISQVVTTLCLNARDAMPEGGRIMIETAPCFLDAAEASRHPDARPGAAARLSVADTGPGIPDELLPCIFDPFCTPQPTGKDTGLGLAMVFGVVKQHHGWIECHSEMGRGTCFDVYLPLMAAASASPLPAPAAGAASGETILVADDNEMLRKLAAAMLRGRGYRVVLAADGQEAVELFQKEPEAIALVLLDMMMPRLSGLQALHELRRIDPDICVVLASGFPDIERGDIERAQVQGFIAKPYRERDLIHAVRTALRTPGAVGNGLCAVP